MTKLKTGIIGASGIGEFHAISFEKTGLCEVVAFVGTSRASILKTAIKLREKYSLNMKGYTSIEKMLDDNEIDIVSVCSPNEYHLEHTKAALDRGVHVLCEKPFYWGENGIKKSKNTIRKAKEKGLILGINMQYICVLEHYKNKFKFDGIKKFNAIWESTGGYKRDDIIIDLFPHLDSMLIDLIPDGVISNLEKTYFNDDRVFLGYDYGNCKVGIELGQEKERKYLKRIFGVNGDLVKCKWKPTGIGADLFFIDEHGKTKIGNPLYYSIKRFVSAVKGEGELLVPPEYGLKNLKNLQTIIDH